MRPNSSTSDFFLQNWNIKEIKFQWKKPHNIVKLLYKEGYILGYELPNTEQLIKNYKLNVITIHLKYNKFGNPLIKKIRIISKPGVRKYVSVNELISLRKKHINLNNMYILSTSSGILPDYRAVKLNTGGELLCKIN